MWDQILDDKPDRVTVAFKIQTDALTVDILGFDAVEDQKEYLKKTAKPQNMTVKQWIRRIKIINSVIPHMSGSNSKLKIAEIIKDVIIASLPKE